MSDVKVAAEGVKKPNRWRWTHILRFDTCIGSRLIIPCDGQHLDMAEIRALRRRLARALWGARRAREENVSGLGKWIGWWEPEWLEAERAEISERRASKAPRRQQEGR